MTGHVQRTIAKVFEDQPESVHSALSLACTIYETSAPTRFQLKAARRAADPIAASKGWKRRTIKGRVQYLRPSAIKPMPSDLAAIMKEPRP
jgi:hypothetical protein